MINVPAKDSSGILSSDTMIAAVRDAEEKMAGKGRVLLRPSGTEPLIRVMVEGQELTFVTKIAEDLADVVRSGLS